MVLAWSFVNERRVRCGDDNDGERDIAGTQNVIHIVMAKGHFIDRHRSVIAVLLTDHHVESDK